MEITPQFGIGRLMIGMNRAEARKVMPALRDNSRKMLKILMPSDISDKDGIELTYDDDGPQDKQILMSIRLFKPARPTLFGRPLLGLSIQDASALLEKMDPGVYIEDDCVVSPLHGIELGTDPEDDDDSDAPVVSVTLFGSFDEEHSETENRIEKELKEKEREKHRSGGQK